MPERAERFDAESVREQWDHAADAWSHALHSGMDDYRIEFFGPAQVEFTGAVNDLRLLDLGCGEGYFSREMADKGAAVTGVDISGKRLGHALAQEANKPLGITYREMDALEIAEEFGPESFDVVTGCMSLMDMPQPDEVIKATARVLRPGGRFVFSIGHPCFDTPYREWHRDADGNKLALKVKDYFERGPIEFHLRDKRMLYETKTTSLHTTLTEWFRWITEAGLTIKAIDEPRPTEDALRNNPDLADAGMVAYFLFFDARKP